MNKTGAKAAEKGVKKPEIQPAASTFAKPAGDAPAAKPAPVSAPIPEIKPIGANLPAKPIEPKIELKAEVPVKMPEKKPEPVKSAPKPEPARYVQKSDPGAMAKKIANFRFGEHLSIQEKINFARHLAIVIKAGLPIYEGLRIIRKQGTSKTMNRVLDQLLTDVNNGRFLSDSLENFNDLFGEFFINIIRVGESSGTLSQNLLYLSEELQKSKELETKVRSAMIYPLVILIATLGVTAFLAFFILPKLLPVLSGLNVQLPLSTRILVGSINFLQSYGIYVAVGIIGLFAFIRFVKKKSLSFRYFIHRLLLAIPVVAPLIISVNMVTFARVLAMLLKSGVKIVEAVNITSNTFTNLVFKRMLTEANEEIKRGGQLATVLGKHPHLFPVLLSGMIQVGENTGNLEDNLFYLSEYYEEETDTKLHNLTALLEPIMLLVMSLLVGFVAISIITPIYSLSQGVK